MSPASRTVTPRRAVFARHVTTPWTLAAALLACACSEPPAPAPPPQAAQPQATVEAKAPAAQPDPAAKTAAGSATAMVEVAPGGTRFDPPVSPEQIPAGAFMCEMGTVHYAAMQQGDGKCPTCGMALRQKGAAGAEHGDHAH